MKIAIIAGGKSSRMGEDKGLMLFGNKPVISHLVDELKPLGLDVFIVANSPSYAALGLPVYEDIIPEKGPMGGIYTALSIAESEVLILSVDSPFISIKTVQSLIQQKRSGRINVVFSGAKMFPLLAVYPVSIVEKLKQRLLKNELKLMQFIEESGFHKINVSLGVAEKFNLNSPQDVELAKTYLSDANKDLR